MLAFILAWVIAIVTGVSQGTGDAPGLYDPPLLPPAAEEHGQGDEATADSGRPDELPANEGAGAPDGAGDQGGGTANRPEQPVVDTSNAPEEIGLGNVPANDNANVPDTVGASENADLPDQAGGNPPDDPGNGGGGNDVAGCAKGSGGSGAAGCAGT